MQDGPRDALGPCVIGPSNPDISPFQLNLEASLICHDPAVVARCAGSRRTAWRTPAA